MKNFIGVPLFYWYVSSHTSIKYQSLFDVSKRNASSDLQVLVENGIIEKTGTTGKVTSYFLRGNIRSSSSEIMEAGEHLSFTGTEYPIAL